MSSGIITKDYLREIFDSHENGVDFVWRIATSRRIKFGKSAGCLKKNGYWKIQINGKQYLRSRLRWLWETGQCPRENIDHIDGNPINDRIENLRECSQAENAQNRKTRNTSTSGFPGVTWRTRAKKWMVQIIVNGKSNFGGYFDNLDDAITKAKELKAEIHKFNPIQRV